ncbi:MAG: glycosyltransferase [Leptospiraceae bacterium]|nr:glycosyltransferase [Leptospiraceae bacterium]
MPRISIITPTLNEEKFLPLLLQSIEKQSFKDYEVIIADAGSTDKTQKIAREYGAKVVPGGMPGPGRNRGADVATGELLFFFDADVVLPENFLEKAVLEMEERFLDLATCEFRPISDLRLDKVMFSISNLVVKLQQDVNPRAAGFCIFITSRLFRRIGGFDESLKLAEDHDLVERASKFRPLRVLNNVHVDVSIRRLEKEGRLALTEKYARVEWNLLTKGAIRDDVVEYEFGNFDEGNEKAKRALDEIEDRLINLEKQYDQFAGEWLTPGKDGKLPGNLLDRFQAGFTALGEGFKTLFSNPK